MDSDHWKTRAKGGMFRREFLSRAPGLVAWLASVGASGWLGDFLAARRQPPAPQSALRHIHMAAAPMSFSVTLRPASLVWTGAEMDVYNRPPIANG